MSTQRARWGLLITTLLLGVALVGTGLAGYLGAQRAMASFVQARGTDLIFAVRRQLLRSGSLAAERMAALLEEMEERGLRFIGVMDRSGDWTASAGEPLGAVEPVTRFAGGAVPVVQLVEDGRRARATALLAPGRGAGRRRGGPGRLGRRGRWAGLGMRRAHLLVLEFEPLEARDVASRALWMLLVGLVATVVLSGAAVFFWRLATRADRMAAQLAKDRQLKSLGEMSAVLGHELRNPLTSLKGHAQLLLEKLPADHAARPGAETVVREAARLEDLTAQVLDFARTGALALKEQDATALVRSAVEEVDGERIRIRLPDGPVAWPLDGERMQQVLVNLLRNALQASPDGQAVELAVAVQNGQLWLEVRDHGEGIAPGEEALVFEPFFTRRARGTGLGLALARRIVEEHGGRLSVSNHADGGAVFRVVLPENREG